MTTPNDHLRQPCLDVYHDQTYTLRKFIGADQFPQPIWEEEKMAMAQMQAGNGGPVVNWGEEMVDDATTRSTYLQAPRKTMRAMVPRPKEEPTWVSGDGALQPEKSMTSYPNQMPKNNEQWQCLRSNASWGRFDRSSVPQNAPQQCIATSAAVSHANPPYIETSFDDHCQLGSDPFPRDPSQACFSPLDDLVSPVNDALFSSFQGSDSGSSADWCSRPLDIFPMTQSSLADESASRDFLNPTPSNISNSINPLSSTTPEWPEQLGNWVQNAQPTHGMYQVYGYGSNPQLATDDMVGMVPSHDRSSAPPAPVSEWCTPEIAYQCSPGPSLTTSFSSCGTPDIQSPINELGYQHLAPIPWTDPSSFRVIPSSSVDAVARVMSRSRGRQRMTMKSCSQRSDSKDAFLVQCKRSGMSYKEIKEKGQFAEAESTLRGRFRTLTKRKEYRVRKPGWHGNDVSNLLVVSSPDYTCRREC